MTHFENPDTGELFDGAEVRITPDFEDVAYGVQRIIAADIEGLPTGNHVHGYTDQAIIVCFPNVVEGRATPGTCADMPVDDAAPFWMAQWHVPVNPV